MHRSLQSIRHFAKKAPKGTGLRAQLQDSQPKKQTIRDEWNAERERQKKQMLDKDKEYTTMKDNRKLFENVEFDSDDKYLVLHHFGGLRLYKINALILLAFFGVSYMNYKKN